MKSFNIGQEVYILKREYIFLLKGVITKKIETTNRWRIKVDFNMLIGEDYGDKEKIVERLYSDNDIFATHKEAYNKAMEIFDNRIKSIEKDKKRFIEEEENKEVS